MDRGAWWTTVHGAQLETSWKLSTRAHTHMQILNVIAIQFFLLE